MTITQAREKLNQLRILDFKLSNELANLFGDKTYEASARRQAITNQLRDQVRPRIAECVKFISQYSDDMKQWFGQQTAQERVGL